LRRKPLPLSFKVFIGTIIGLVFVVWLGALSNTINNPEKTLANTAANLTGRSKSAEQMIGNIKHFDHAIRQFLQKYGALNTNELANKLTACLPHSLYESHVFELLPNLKLVEIDTALNASNYFVLLNNGKVEVMPIIGLDVYDSNSFLPHSDKTPNSKNENEGQLLVLLGHSAGIHGHRPRVKVFLISSTMQSDNIVDLTDTVLPKTYGEGNAKFSPNQKDIELSISTFSRGQELNVFSPEQLKSSLPVEDELLYEQLIWQNNSYTLRRQTPTSKMYALYALANALKNHDRSSSLQRYLSVNAKHIIDQNSLPTGEKGFTISSLKGTKKTNNFLYILKNDVLKAIIELRPITTGRKGPGSNMWYVNSLTLSKPSSASIAHATQTTNLPTSLPIAPSATQSTNQVTRSQPITQTTSTPTTQISNSSANQPITQPNKVENIQQTYTNQQGFQVSFLPDLRSNIKLRSGPGTNYRPVYEVTPNRKVTIIGKENGWYRAKIDNKEGYIFAGLVNNNHRSNDYKNATIKFSTTIKDEKLHSAGNVHAGEYVVILNGLKNNRYKIISSNGKTGYVSKEAIDGNPVESPPPSVP
jgi:hypothetical protein